MSTIKRITVFIFAALILAANLPLCASAVEVATQEDKAAGCLPVIQIFGQSHNVQYIFDAQTTAENIDMLLDLWGQYTTQVNNAVSLDTMYNQILTDNTYQITEAGLLAFDISSSLSGMLTSFWDFVMSGVAEMVRVDNEYSWSVDQNGNIASIPIIQEYDLLLNGVPVHRPPYTYTVNGSTYTYEQADSTQFYVSVGKQVNSTTKYVILIYPSTFNYYLVTNNVRGDMYNGTKSFGWYQARSGYNDQNNSINTDFEASSFTDLSEIFGSPTTASESEKELSISPYEDNSEITLPSTSDTPVAIQLTSDFTPSIGQIGDEADLIQIGQEATESIFDDQYGIQQEVPPEVVPGEVYVPFLPVTLPNFNFNLSGIWHYVREWIASLGAWFTTVLTVWASLPYAMVVPVYATLVIVIVLGVYKRFFM